MPAKMYCPRTGNQCQLPKCNEAGCQLENQLHHAFNHNLWNGHRWDRLTLDNRESEVDVEDLYTAFKQRIISELFQ